MSIRATPENYFQTRVRAAATVPEPVVVQPVPMQAYYPAPQFPDIPPSLVIIGVVAIVGIVGLFGVIAYLGRK